MKNDIRALEGTEILGIIGVMGLLLYGIYFGGLWYFNRDYLERNRNELIAIYRQIPDPERPVKEEYKIHSRWLSYYLEGKREYAHLSKESGRLFFEKYFLENGWNLGSPYDEKVPAGYMSVFPMKKGELELRIYYWEDTSIWEFKAIKKDWIYVKGY